MTVVPEGGGGASTSAESSGSSEKKFSRTASAAPRGSGSGSAAGDVVYARVETNGAKEAEVTDCPHVDEVEEPRAGDDASEAAEDADVARGSENARRSARRAEIRREVTALQRLKLRLEKVRDALVREK